MARKALHALVTAGPTREHLDDVRFLSNASSGRLGWEVASALRRRGVRVTLVLGPCELPDPRGVETVRVTSAAEMLAAARRGARGADLAVFAAAPADWRPARRRRGKPRKGGAARRALDLVATADIAATLGRTKGRRVHVGFALEATRAVEGARRKAAAKRFDAVVANGPANLGAGGGEVTWVEAGRPLERLPARPKSATARAIVVRALALCTVPGTRTAVR